MDEEIIKTQAITTVIELLKDRNYKILPLSDNEDKDIVVEAIRVKNEIETERIYVFLCMCKLNIKLAKEKLIFSKKMNSDCILIYNEDITTSAKKSIDTMDVQIELFAIKELQLNITKHRLVPKHEKVDQRSEEYASLKKYKIPIMLSLDPVSRYYNYKKGDIIRVTRKNGIISYRQVK